MTKEALLELFDRKQINFHGDFLTAVVVEQDLEFHVFVPLRPICKYLGLSFSGQYERMLRHPVLSKELRHIRIPSDARGGNPNKLCLPIEFIPGWLFGISPQRVRPALKEKVLLYQKECFQALSDAFQDSLLPIKYLATPPKAITKIETNIYPLTLQQIREAVSNQCHRAEKQGLPATLTLSQWLYTLKFFEGNCAYCQGRPGIILEHFLPLSLNVSGTTVGNCVPSCFSCNTKKLDKPPNEVTEISQEVVAMIQRKLAYLESQFPF